MCGIIGCVGKKTNLVNLVLDGLSKLEYRGYDSSGIAYYEDGEIKIKKAVGRISELKKIVNSDTKTNIAIGHTRWATHGGVNILNSHPHCSSNKKVTLVHNGVIENFKELKNFLLDKGFTFYSETDSEIIANLIALYYRELKPLEAIKKTMESLKGSYALAIIFDDDISKLYFAKNETPLLIGLGKEQNYIASDIIALNSIVNEFVCVEEKQYGFISESDINIYENESRVSYKSFKCDFENGSIEKGLYQHFMEKEINEQPSVIRRIINRYIKKDKICFDNEFENDLKSCDRIYIVACGTSYHAGLIGKHLIEQLAKKEVQVYIASEFSYQVPLLSEKPLFILISQSGETADLRKALTIIKNYNSKVYTLTNVITSSLARLSDGYIDLLAGPEIAVASTKAYVAQVTILTLIAYLLANKVNAKEDLQQVIGAQEEILKKRDKLYEIVLNKIYKSRSCFYIGRLEDYLLCLESALKMKEISYIQTEGFAGGELKHGTIALIEKDVPVIALISDILIADQTRTNIEEVRSRGATTIVISTKEVAKEKDDVIIPNTNHLLSPLTMVIVVQYFAYFAALLNKRDIDKPRNLAKSVTVE